MKTKAGKRLMEVYMQKEVHPRKKIRGDIWHPSEEAIGKLLKYLTFVILGALCGSAELLFGVRPFGIALAAATTHTMPAAALGVALFAIFTRDWLSLSALGILIFLRAGFAFFSRDPLGARPFLRERPMYRILSAAVSLFSVGLYTVIRNGYRYFDLFGVLLALCAAPLTAFLFLGLSEEKNKFFPLSREAGFATLIMTSVFAIREVSIFGVCPAAVGAAMLAFVLVAKRGLTVGTIGATLVGLCYDFRMAPAFLLCALAFGLLEKSSRGGGVLAGGAAAAAYAFLIRHNEGLIEMLPSLLTAGALFLATDSAGIIAGTPLHRQVLSRKRAAAQAAKAGEQWANETQFKEISGAFSDLSGTFYELSNRLRRPSLSDLRRLCDRAFDSVCPGCRHRDICWGTEYAKTAAAVSLLGEKLHSRGSVTEKFMPPELVARCGELPKIISVINSGAATLSEETLRGDKTAVVAMDYAAAGRMIAETLEENRENFAPDVALGEKILSKLSRSGYLIESVAVCGKEHRRILLQGVRLPGRHIKMRELRGTLEQLCKFQLGDPEIRESEGLSDIIFPEHCALETVTVKLTRPKGRGENKHCGDSVSAVSGARGYDYALICDGMGSGTSAALTSALASAFLSRLLQAGNRADTSLRMLNGFLAARGRRESESSTTVDLLEIDRVNGKASFFKCGAAPSFLLRKGSVTRFFSRTAPVGILESLDAERIRFELQPGDVVVQVSDGFTDGEEDCPFLADMLRTMWDRNAEDFARLALNRATKESKDDLSIMVTEVRAAPAPGVDREIA